MKSSRHLPNEKCKKICLLLACLTLLISKENYSQEIFRRVYYFENNQSELSVDQRFDLNELIEKIGKDNYVQILGYANALGDEEKNLSLSERRATTIRDYILSTNVDAQKIEVRFFGEKFAQEEENSIVKSRRAEVVIIEQKDMPNPFQPDDVPEVFQINPNEDTTIIGKKGTKIFIRAGTILNPNTGELPERATVQIQEYLSMTDIIEKGLTTRSDGRALESGGMINLKIMEGTQELEIRKGKDISISMPCNKCRRGMTTFIGDTTNGQLNWKEIKVKPSKIVSREIKPLFAEGKESIVHFIQQNRRYPSKAFEKSIEGTVQIKFTIDEEGNTISPTIVKSVESTLDKEAMRVVSLFPKWTPASIDGQPKSYKYNVSIAFKINNDVLNGARISSLGGSIDYVEDNRMDSLSRQREKEEWIERQSEMQAAVDLGYYVITTSKLGWINCDRFLTQSLTNFIVDANTIESVKVYLIVKSQKSLFVNEARVNSKFNFRQIGDNEDVYILAIKSTQGKLALSLNETNTGQKSFLIDNYRESTLQELKKVIETLRAN